MTSDTKTSAHISALFQRLADNADAMAKDFRAASDAVMEMTHRDDAEYDEDAEDLAAHRAALTGHPPEDFLSGDEVLRMVRGESPLVVWREHRNMTATALAKAAGVSPGYFSEIENGKKPGSAKAWKSLAKALNLTVDDIMN
ncbi:MAG: helix-turn-helix transcriptional regulator [Alphaproteobacteria bacterium]|nr:helix-turn-helix transcriptional regulator [Alphaproteobacteria bacterium]